MRKNARIAIITVVAVIVLALVGGYLYFYNLTRCPLPQHDGELEVAGLNDTVEILRDEWGIPHIYASNLHDLFFAQGYTQAQDRWWQMEFSRHQGSGTIEELVGKNTDLLPADIFLRTIGWHRVAEQEVKNLDEETLAALQAFTDGINAYIMSRKPGKLALEYSVLGLTGIDIEIKPWTPVDTLVWAKVMAWDLGLRGSKDELRAKLYQAIGQEMTDQWLTPPWPFGEKPTIVQPEDLQLIKSTSTTQLTGGASTSESEALLTMNLRPSSDPGFTADQDLGSNNWVVSGRMTQSNMPLLANDPHLGIQMPSIWYQIGLHCQSADGRRILDVTGFALAASPGVVIGHNSHIAWGLTNVFPDVHDLYRIHVNPNNPLQYEWNGEWRNMTVHKETIYFGDSAEPITIQVRETHLGPIINDNQIDEESSEILGFNNEDPLALRWTVLNPCTIARSIIMLDKATNWEEFRNALRYWDVPSQNFVYADIEGNIGYQVPGRIPIRAQNHSGLVPVPGWTDEFEWQGYLPFDSLPRIFNPERGYIATANQAVVPLEYYDQLAKELGEGRNYVISHEWNYGYRGQRLVEMLEEKAPHTIASFQAIQGDNKLISAEELMPYLVRLQFNDTELTEVRDWLLEWDGHCDMDSPRAALYAGFWAALMHNLYDDQLGEEAEAEGASREMWATFLLMKEPGNTWWDDSRTKDVVETRDDVLIRSFREGYSNTMAALGKNRNKWKWSDLHTSTFVSSPLGMSGIGLIEGIVNRGPFATGGSTDVLNATRWTADSGTFAVASLPSMRMIIDLGDFTRSVTVHTTGQSGHPASKNYDDMIDLWRNIKYYPMLWTRGQVEAAAVSKLILRPK